MKKIEDYLPEIWAEIEGFSYSVSSWGKVRNNLTGQVLKMPLAGKGYPSVLLYHPTKKPTKKLVHRLVGKYFVPNPNNYPEINHLFGNKLDNYFEHLAWSTSKENINHAFSTGLNIKVKQNDNKRSKPVIQLDLDGVEIQEYPSLKQVERSTGFKHPNIHHAIKNKIISHGYLWKYKN